MKAQAVLSIILILVPSLSGFHDTFLLASPSLVTEEEQIVIGRLGEDIILPCSFESEPEVVIHWKNQDKYAYSYYKDRDYLENQDHKYTNRTSLFHSEIHNGNASLSLRRLSLLDEGIYVCYVGTTSRKIINKVVLKVGVFVTPVMKYEKRNIDSFLICSVLSYPHPLITWKTDNTSISESNMGEMESLDPFYVYSMINITGSNLSYECAIENSLLKQTWTGGWTMKDDLHKMQSENFSLSCALTNSIFLLDQDFIVTWYNMEKETSSILAFFLSSSRNATIYEPRVSWNKEQINQSDFSLTLKDLSLSDSGKYLCNISSSKYTFLTIQTLRVVVYTKQSIRTIPSLTKEASQNLPFSRKPWPVETRGGLPTLPPPEREQSQSRTAWIIILPLVILGFLAIGIFCMLKRHNCSRRERSSEGPY